jgi:hydrogenase maturation protease
MTDKPNEQSTANVAGLLVIGYGNELRSDDCVGPRVAEAVAEMKLAGVRAIACHQLTPELAEAVSLAGAVVFVDAAADSGLGVQTRMIGPSRTAQIMAHAGDPRCLLALARDVFGRCPPAWEIVVPGKNFDFGERLSAQAARGLAFAVGEIKRLWARQGSASGTVAGSILRKR